MAQPGATSAQGVGAREPRHFLRLFVTWVIVAGVGDVLWYVFAGPHIPPGALTTTAAGQQFDFNVLFVTAWPVVFAVWLYLAYAIYNWRESRARPGEPNVLPSARTQSRVQVIWIAVTSALVLWAFAFGTFELVAPEGAGGGQGPNPIWTPTSHVVLPVQVIAQQWKFTYRYPTFGGFETNQLMLPNDTTIAFHVTSLDVVHDFWAYQLGVKADANPGVDNVAFTTTRQTGLVTVRCDELCGLWHGAMYDYGHVVSKQAFATWAKETERRLAANTKLLPPFAYTYSPDANGADGGFYPTNVDPYSKVQLYGAAAKA